MSGERLHSADGARLVTRNIWTNELHKHARADLYIFVGFQESETSLYTAAREEFTDLESHVVGDARAPRLLRHAVLEGVEVGMNA